MIGSMAGPNPGFWQDRFEKGQTNWDRGGVSPQLRSWLDTGALSPSRICVPGCGSGWEVAELARHGFDVTGVDYTPAAVERARASLERRELMGRVEQANVLTWCPEQPFDAIYEQTCLCALHPDHWAAYARQLHAWLRPAGTLWAMFMQTLAAGAAEGRIEGPPYHCDIHAMRALFPADRWDWPKPPYPRVPHPRGMAELAVPLVRR
jgi:SAM-dependent methyltransferase